MKLVETMVRMFTPAAVAGASLLLEELSERGITVPLTDAFVRELVADAIDSSRAQAALGEEIARRAEFLEQWTLTDDRLGVTCRCLLATGSACPTGRAATR